MTKKTISCKYLILKILFFLMIVGSIQACKNKNTSDKTFKKEFNFDFITRIPAGGNAWIINDADKNAELVSSTGIHNWTKKDDVIGVYFATWGTGEIQVGLNIKVPEGITTLKVSLDGVDKKIQIDNSEYQDISVGKFMISTQGYHRIELSEENSTGNYIADVSEILLGGAAAISGVNFIKVKENFYFGRRGPSDHLNFTIPQDRDITYFYNEIEVPQGEDKIGSYFMADGFDHGYFGIQVNSEKERRVIFSVWSPYNTDDPSAIPEDQRIVLLDKGQDVDAGEFGDEGSGGHSHLVYNWKAGTTYKFLLKGQPSVNNSSDYSAYFYAPELEKWQLIASFRRPKTKSYLKGFYSFLENFDPKTGDQERKAYYKNQWVYDTKKNWIEVTEAKFTVDATARAGRRLDYSGGVEEGDFFLRNCGFFSDNTEPDTVFTRPSSNQQPEINFDELN